MECIKCKNCGKELELIGTLTEAEIQNINFIETKEMTVNTALEKDVCDFKAMSPEQVYSYFKATFDLKAEAAFLNIENFRAIAERLNVENMSDTDYTNLIKGLVFKTVDMDRKITKSAFCPTIPALVYVSDELKLSK